jgi:hypothetical protein
LERITTLQSFKPRNSLCQLTIKPESQSIFSFTTLLG